MVSDVVWLSKSVSLPYVIMHYVSWLRACLPCWCCVVAVCRVLPQVLLTVLVVLSPQSFSNVYYYGLAVAGMCLCHVLNVIKAASIYSSKPDGVAAAVAVVPGVPAVAAAAAAGSSSKPATKRVALHARSA